MTPPPKRLWLPLLILRRSGGVYSKTYFQKLVFMIQYEGMLDYYNFHRDRYGPYSDELSLETASYPDLIDYHLNQTFFEPQHEYYSYQITNNGVRVLRNLAKRIPAEERKRIDPIVDKYIRVSKDGLIEQVYERFAVKEENSEKFLKDTSKELTEVIPTFVQWYNLYKNRQSMFLLSNLQVVEQVVSKLDGVYDSVHRGVVLNLVEEVLHKSMAAAEFMTPLPNSDSLRPIFVEIGDLMGYLMQYCGKRGIYKSPFSLSLEELMTEEEAKRLAQTLSDLPIPA